MILRGNLDLDKDRYSIIRVAYECVVCVCAYVMSMGQVLGRSVVQKCTCLVCPETEEVRYRNRHIQSIKFH